MEVEAAAPAAAPPPEPQPQQGAAGPADDAALQERIAWAAAMRQQFSPDGMCRPDGSIDQVRCKARLHHCVRLQPASCDLMPPHRAQHQHPRTARALPPCEGLLPPAPHHHPPAGRREVGAAAARGAVQGEPRCCTLLRLGASLCRNTGHCSAAAGDAAAVHASGRWASSRPSLCCLPIAQPQGLERFGVGKWKEMIREYPEVGAGAVVRCIAMGLAMCRGQPDSWSAPAIDAAALLVHTPSCNSASHPPAQLARYKDTDVRVHAGRLLGAQSLARHVGWKGARRRLVPCRPQAACVCCGLLWCCCPRLHVVLP